MPHLCKLQDIKLSNLFNEFIKHCRELTKIINSHIIDDEGLWIHCYIHIHGDTLHLNREPRANNYATIKNLIDNLIYNKVINCIKPIHIKHQEIIDYINSNYPEIKM